MQTAAGLREFAQQNTRKRRKHYLKLALGNYNKIFPPDHIEYANLWIDASDIAIAAEDYSKAIFYRKKAIEIYCSIYFENSPEVCTEQFTLKALEYMNACIHNELDSLTSYFYNEWMREGRIAGRFEEVVVYQDQIYDVEE